MLQDPALEKLTDMPQPDHPTTRPPHTSSVTATINRGGDEPNEVYVLPVVPLCSDNDAPCRRAWPTTVVAKIEVWLGGG